MGKWESGKVGKWEGEVKIIKKWEKKEKRKEKREKVGRGSEDK